MANIFMPNPERMPYLRIYPEALLNDPDYEDLSPAEFGIMMRLAFEQIRRGGWLPNDNKKLGKLSNARTSSVEALRKKTGKIQSFDNDQTKCGLSYVKKQYEAFMERSNQGKENANKRWHPEDGLALPKNANEMYMYKEDVDIDVYESVSQCETSSHSSPQESSSPSRELSSSPCGGLIPVIDPVVDVENSWAETVRLTPILAGRALKLKPEGRKILLEKIRDNPDWITDVFYKALDFVEHQKWDKKFLPELLTVIKKADQWAKESDKFFEEEFKPDMGIPDSLSAYFKAAGNL